MGQFGPTLKNNRAVRRFADSGLYALGAVLSSLASVFVLDLAGNRFRDLAGPRVSVLTALVLSGLLLAVDGLRVWGGRSTSLGPDRQTPHAWRLRGPVGILGWGLDTGVPVSTIRATSLPMLGVILVATGHAGPLHGLYYGCGLVVGVLIGLLALRPGERSDRGMDRIVRKYRSMGPARLVLAPTALVTTVLAASLAVVA